MSPVRPSRTNDSRTVALAVGGLVLGIVGAIALVAFALPRLTEQGKVEVKLGDDRFSLGLAATKAPSIAQDGPALFSDVGGGNRDIFVQHLGDDPNSGWYAFDARRPDQTRDCSYEWDKREQQFTNPCDGSTIPPDGAGLRQYVVVVDKDGRVQVDLRSAQPPPGGGGTTTSSSSSSTSSTIQVTGR